MKRNIFIAVFFILVTTISFCVSAQSETNYSKKPTSGTFTDARDNVTYKWVKIGTQVWMAENLGATSYNDGISIPNISNQTMWNNMNAGAYCYYNNDAINYKNSYGCLYNWYAVNTGKLAPKGWHVPTDAEWTTLRDYLGGEDLAGDKMKSTKGWDTDANNSSGFSALPGGYRNKKNDFALLNTQGCWWSSSEDDSDCAFCWNLYCDISFMLRISPSKNFGFSVRCVRDN